MSGWRSDNQATALSTRCLMELTFQVAMRMQVSVECSAEDARLFHTVRDSERAGASNQRRRGPGARPMTNMLGRGAGAMVYQSGLKPPSPAEGSRRPGQGRSRIRE